MWRFLLVAFWFFAFAFVSNFSVEAQTCDGPTYCAGPCDVWTTECRCVASICLNSTGFYNSSSGLCEVYKSGGGVCCSYDDSGDPHNRCGHTTCLCCSTSTEAVDCPYNLDAFGTGWCMNVCSGGEDPPEEDPPPPDKPWCTVTVNGGLTTAQEGSNNVSVYLQADANSSTNKNVMLYVTKRNAAAMSPVPAGTLQTVTYSGWPDNSYSYNFYRMRVYQSASNLIDPSTTLTLPEGEYYIMCNVEGADGGSCSGNPFCGFNAPLNPDSGLTPYLTCSGWASCSDNDVKYLNVTAPYVTVSGNVYEDDAGSCASTTNPTAAFEGAVTLAGNATSRLDTANQSTPNYSFSNVKGNATSGIDYTATFALTSGNYALTPGCLTQHPFKVYNSDISGYNFYITQKKSPWFQVVKGDIGAGNGSITGGVPATLFASPSNQRFSMPYLTSGDQQAGVVINSDTYTPAAQAVSSATWKANNAALALDQGYEYFLANFELGVLTDNIDDLISAVPASADNPKVFWNDTDLVVQGMTVSDGIPVVIFVRGNVSVTGNIDVADGNFLAIVADGSITFGPNVTVAEGVFIADKTLTVLDAAPAVVGIARQFKGEGVFAGLGEDGGQAVVLARNLNSSGDSSDDLANNSNPGEIFTYRPEFLLLAPDGFKSSPVFWKEIETVNMEAETE